MILLLLLAFLLDFYISFYFSFLNPFLFVITVLTYLILKNKKKDLSTIFISLIIYDLLFSKTLFLNLFTILFLYEIIKYFKRHLNLTFPIFFLLLSFIFILYLTIEYILLLETKLIYLPFSFLFTQILLSFPLNITYGVILYIILGLNFKKH